MIDLTFAEVGALSCAIASENTWKRGKRNFMVCSRNLIGFKLELRHKRQMMSIKKEDDWRIIIDPFSGIRVFWTKPPYEVENFFRLAMPSNTSTNLVYAENLSAKLEYDIKNPSQFENDWTLLRLFSSQWEQFK